MEEVERILSEHPPGEKTKIIERERLLGQLAPLRAFGDFRYKWSREELERLAVPRYGKTVIAPHYETPPYLTAKPDVMYHRISPKDKFLVIASDGLWDLLSPLQVTTIVDNFSITTTTTTTFSSLVGVISSMSKGLAIVYIAHLDPFTVIGRQVVRMVGEHMSGRAALSPLRLPHNMKLKDINTILEQRKDGLNKQLLERRRTSGVQLGHHPRRDQGVAQAGDEKRWHCYGVDFVFRHQLEEIDDVTLLLDKPMTHVAGIAVKEDERRRRTPRRFRLPDEEHVYQRSVQTSNEQVEERKLYAGRGQDATTRLVVVVVRVEQQ
ncbi:unnamed protein product, partial [Nesidiocoris tenuis]